MYGPIRCRRAIAPSDRLVRQALSELLPSLRSVLSQVEANLRDWKLLDSAAASNDMSTIEELDRSSRTHSRRNSRCFSRTNSTSSFAGSPMPGAVRFRGLGGSSDISNFKSFRSPPAYIPSAEPPAPVTPLMRRAGRTGGRCGRRLRRTWSRLRRRRGPASSFAGGTARPRPRTSFSRRAGPRRWVRPGDERESGVCL